MLKNKLSMIMLIAAGLIIGLGAGVAGLVTAQTTGIDSNERVNQVANVNDDVSQAATGQTIATTAPSTTTAPATAAESRGHAPLGGDGVISSINGTTIVMTEEADEGGAAYTVDASNATVTNNGVAGNLADLKVGDKIFVQGPVNGTNVTATAVFVGRGACKGFGYDKNNQSDNDGSTGGSNSTSTNQ